MAASEMSFVKGTSKLDSDCDQGYGSFDMADCNIDDTKKELIGDSVIQGSSITPLKLPEQNTDQVPNQLKRGRNVINKFSKGSYYRPKRNCPICFKTQLSTNLVRHLKGAHRVQDHMHIERLSIEASKAGHCGPRAVKFDDLPWLLRSKWHLKRTRMETDNFFKKYQLVLAQENFDEK